MAEWIIATIAAGGLMGVAALMLLENVFPPIPAELIMPLAGLAAARGEMDFTGVVAAGTAGAVAGATFWYWIGRKVGEARLKRWAARSGRWLTLTPREIDAATGFFRARGGAWAVLLGRLMPGVRTYISIPAGLARMRLGRFLAFTSVGAAAWTWALAGAGYWLGERYGAAIAWLDPVAGALLGVAGAFYAYRVATFDTRAER